MANDKILALIGRMALCEQAYGYSTLQHGIDCYRSFLKLREYVEGGREPDGFVLPSWVKLYRAEMAARLHHPDTTSAYVIFHDCGKWVCREVDVDGRQHFPDHAQASVDVFEEHFDDEAASRLIRYDMSIHTATSVEITALLDIWCTEDACTLMLAALAEIHANAKMFGGIDSISFKIKAKHAAKRSKQICRVLFGDK